MPQIAPGRTNTREQRAQLVSTSDGSASNRVTWPTKVPTCTSSSSHIRSEALNVAKGVGCTPWENIQAPTRHESTTPLPLTCQILPGATYPTYPRIRASVSKLPGPGPSERGSRHRGGSAAAVWSCRSRVPPQAPGPEPRLHLAETRIRSHIFTRFQLGKCQVAWFACISFRKSCLAIQAGSLCRFSRR